jgi:hypothetical protein
LINLAWFVFDVDRNTACFDYEDLHVPAPNFLVYNPENGHAHLFYGLVTPVHKQYNAHIEPLKYAASIETGLCSLLGADTGYSGLVSKCPSSNKWPVIFVFNYLYDLDWLADYLPSKNKFRKPIIDKTYGLGRNCSLFDTARLWAYSEIRNPAYKNNLALFREAVDKYAQAQNLAAFPTPLHSKEVGHISKSISKWVFRHLSTEGFSKWGEGRRAASLVTRRGNLETKLDKINQYLSLAPGSSLRQISRDLLIPETTVRRLLKNKFSTQ